MTLSGLSQAGQSQAAMLRRAAQARGVSGRSFIRSWQEKQHAGMDLTSLLASADQIRFSIKGGLPESRAASAEGMGGIAGQEPADGGERRGFRVGEANVAFTFASRRVRMPNVKVTARGRGPGEANVKVTARGRRPGEANVKVTARGRRPGEANVKVTARGRRPGEAKVKVTARVTNGSPPSLDVVTCKLAGDDGLRRVLELVTAAVTGGVSKAGACQTAPAGMLGGKIMAAVTSWLDKTLWPAVALLVAVLVYFQISDADIALQDYLFDFAKGEWLVDRFAWWPTFLFHKLLKWLIIAFAASLLVRLIAVKCRKMPSWVRPVPAREAWIVLLCLGLTPAIVGLGKKYTNVFCPWDIERYGGEQPYVKTWSSYDPAHPPKGCGQCWPAGHASGGFALVALATLATTRRGRMFGTLAGLLVGGIMGGYQMLKGAHYTSDTLVTMLLAWIIHLALRRCLLRAAINGSGGA